MFASSLEVRYLKQLCDALADAFICRFVEQGLQLLVQPSLQHQAKAATLQQAPTLKLPLLVPACKSRIVAFYHDDQAVWPNSPLPLASMKALHEVKFGGVERVKHGMLNEDTSKRISEELLLWNVDLSLENFFKQDLQFNRMLIFGLQSEPLEFLDQALKVARPVNVHEVLPHEFFCRSGQHVFTCAFGPGQTLA